MLDLHYALSPLRLAGAGHLCEIATVKEIIFTVAADEAGSFSASWDDPRGGGISTQGEDLTDLYAMIRDAVLCHFDEGEIPARVGLHVTEDPALTFARNCPVTFPARKSSGRCNEWVLL